MRYATQILSTLTACLSLTSSAFAQAAPEEAPPAPPSPVGDTTANPAAPTLPPPPAPAADLSPAPTGPATPSTTAAGTPVPSPPLRVRVSTHDCASNWTRSGFYLRIGSGIGDVTVTGTGPQGNASVSGLGGNTVLAIGGSVVPGLVLAGTARSSSISGTFDGGPFGGATVTSTGKSAVASNKADASSIELGLLVDWYPDPADGWHVGISGGLGAISIKNHADDSTMSGASGGGSLFGGYDWSIGPGWSFGLSLVGSATLAASLKDTSDQPNTGYRMKAYSVGLSGSFLYF